MNFTVDGITDMDTGSNTTLHYEPNMDAIQETEGPHLELPGRIRTQLRRHHHRRHQERHPAISTAPPHGITGTRGSMPISGRTTATAETRSTCPTRRFRRTVSTSKPTASAAPSSSRSTFNRQEEQAVLLLVAGIYRTVRHRRNSEQVHAHRAGAPRRISPRASRTMDRSSPSPIPPRARRSRAT